MEPGLILSAASVLVCASASGAVPTYGHPQAMTSAPLLRIVPPVIELSARPIRLDAELEAIIFSSMSQDFERRYAL